MKNGKFVSDPKPLKQEKKKRKPINRVSAKRKEEEKVYIDKRKAFLIKYPICQCRGCHRQSEDVHHMAGRVGKLYLDENYWLATCRPHHGRIELQPDWAKLMGYSVTRTDK